MRSNYMERKNLRKYLTKQLLSEHRYKDAFIVYFKNIRGVDYNDEDNVIKANISDYKNHKLGFTVKDDNKYLNRKLFKLIWKFGDTIDLKKCTIKAEVTKYEIGGNTVTYKSLNYRDKIGKKDKAIMKFVKNNCDMQYTSTQLEKYNSLDEIYSKYIENSPTVIDFGGKRTELIELAIAYGKQEIDKKHYEVERMQEEFKKQQEN